MKKLFITSLLVILSIPAICATNDGNLESQSVPNLTVDSSAKNRKINTNITPQAGTSPFASAKSATEAWKIFESETQKILDEAKSKLKRSEYKKLSKLRDELLADKPGATKPKNTKEKSNKDAKNDDNKTVAERKLTPEEQEKKIAELRDNATAMKEKEQSTENKMLGAAAIGATGIGGMQLASAMAEQSADNDAEQAMRAYLATFTCQYGDSRVSGGKKDIELPGGNELISLYSEYVALANDLKTRKNALGIKPGIESEAILDSAKSALYDDQGLEPRTGAYASLARAMSDPNSEDAKMWAAQREETAKKLKTGAITAGIGAVGGLVGNLAINANAPKERSAEINAKYAKLKQEAEVVKKEIKKQETVLLQKETCQKYGATGEFNNCTCADDNSYWDSNSKKCVQCSKNETVNETKNGCIQPTPTCTLGETLRKAGKCECVDNASATNETTCTCNLTGAFNATTCTCNEHATLNGNNCECAGDYTQEEGSTNCIQKTVQEAPKITTISLNADILFEPGKSTISVAGENALKATIYKYLSDNLLNSTDLLSNSCLTFSGYADRSGNHQTNQTLSEQRAETIAKLLLADSNGTIPTNINNYRIYGKGDADCTEKAYPTKKDYAQCRRVDITIRSGACDGSTTTDSTTTFENITEQIQEIAK